MYDRCIVVTRQTRLQELIARFNTKAQAKFYIEHAGGDFEDYTREDETYSRSLDIVRKQLSRFDLKLHVMDRQYLPNYVFADSDLVLVVGQDGLVANAAKYVGNRPIIGINPDRSRFDGILVPTLPDQAARQILSVMDGSAVARRVSLAEVRLNDGQQLLAFNDFYIGARTHVSARYRIEFSDRNEQQSSSGIIVSTGAGSTGWLSSVFNMVSSVNQFATHEHKVGMHMEWDSRELVFIVREPFVSRHSSANIVAGKITDGQELVIESRMSVEGTIFSDGVESDFIPFNAGAIARIRLAQQQANLVINPDADTCTKKRSESAQPVFTQKVVPLPNEIDPFTGRYIPGKVEPSTGRLTHVSEVPNSKGVAGKSGTGLLGRLRHGGRR